MGNYNLCGLCWKILANSLEYPERIQRGLEWTQFLKRLSVGQLPRLSREDPERIRVDSVFETSVCSLSVCLFFVIKFSNFFLFHPPLFIQYSTEECSTVQYKAAGHCTHKTSLRVKKTIPESMPCIVAHSTRRYIGTAVGPLHPELHRNGA